jgi:transcriptional regulator with XRE-family HTH domain
MTELSLGSFLRSRRERVSPATVGLPAGGRRRTPGLRREEVASLAGISVDYLVRLEQDRESHPSAAVIAALGDALGLSPDELRHAAKLAAASSCSELCPTTPPSSHLQPSTLELLDRLDPTPAFVVDHVTNVLAWNQAFDRLMRPTAFLDRDPPNLLRYLFLEPASRQLYQDWHATARAQVSNLRAASTLPHQYDDVTAIVAELCASSEEFAQLWATHDVGEQRRGTTSLVHPEFGLLDLDFDVLIVNDPSEHRLVTYLASDQASAGALEHAVSGSRGRPALRVIDRGA